MGSMHAVYSLSVVSAGVARLQKAQICANRELNLFHISMQCRWLRENKTCYACCRIKWQTNGEPCWQQSSMCHQWYRRECKDTENYYLNGRAHGRQIRKRQPSEEDASNVVELMPKPKRGRVDKPTSDVGQCASRNNPDLQFMPRAPVLDDNTISTGTQDSAGKPAAEQSKEKVLSYDRAEAFYGFRRHLQQNLHLRRAAYSMLAMWQASHNTDYYITKYGTKALEKLQCLITQFALGLRRLEQDEEWEQSAIDEEVMKDLQSYHKRCARRVTLRLAMAANRSTWVSCCEMALFLRTGAHVRRITRSE